jgi:hypothetical protein
MPITPCFDPTTGASGGAAPGGGTAPGLTVTGRTNGSGYTVTAGARSLSISNPDAATLLTTVKKASERKRAITAASQSRAAQELRHHGQHRQVGQMGNRCRSRSQPPKTA